MIFETPSLGESARHSCPRSHGRMSSFSLDKHSVCIKCLCSDCGMDSRYDECMSWSSEEMESYIKLRKSLASKGRGRKSGFKTPSSPGHDAPVVNVDVDDKFASHIATLSKDVDEKISAMSEGLMVKVSELLGQFQNRMSNRSLSAEPEVLLASLHPCDALSALMFTPISFRVPQVDRCLQVRALPNRPFLVSSQLGQV